MKLPANDSVAPRTPLGGAVRLAVGATLSTLVLVVAFVLPPLSLLRLTEMV